MRLYLIRHGQTAWNADQRAQGHTDVPLDETGRKQASCVAGLFLDRPVDLVLTSDLSRSHDTARAVAEACGARLEVTAQLRERCFGEWEGLPYQEFARLSNSSLGEAVNSLYEVCPPGGESMKDAWNRVLPITERLFRSVERVAVVSHGGVCALMLAQLLRGSLDTSRGFRFLNCSVTELIRRPEGQYQLLRYNDTSHLDSTGRPTHAGTAR